MKRFAVKPPRYSNSNNNSKLKKVPLVITSPYNSLKINQTKSNHSNTNINNNNNHDSKIKQFPSKSLKGNNSNNSSSNK